MDPSEKTILNLRPLAEKEAFRYLKTRQEHSSPITRNASHARHFFSWTLRLLMPDLLVGHPSLWDNLRILFKNPNFRPLRMAIAAWAIFALSIGSASVYLIKRAPASEAAGWYGSSWQYRKKITIDHAKVAADLTNFPVLISLSSDSHLSANASSTGADILFTAEDGTTKLNHEIETYSSSTGALKAWVNTGTSTLSSSVDTILYMYYGNASAANQSNKTSVWNANYLGVWHMADGNTLSVNDSTSNLANGSNNTATASGGQIDGAASFNGTSDYITVPAATNASYSISMWVKSEGNSGYTFIWEKQTPSSAPSLEGTDSGYSFYANGNQSISAGSVTPGSWYYIVAMYDSASRTQSLYVNNVLKGTNTNISSSSITSLVLAHRAGSAFYFKGGLDEVRFSNTQLSPSWITTEYNNQSSPSTFYALGAQELQNSSPATPTSISPASGTSGRSLTPTLTASAFSDPDVGDTQTAAQWQISTSSGNYSSPLYDSGRTSTSLTSLAVPAGILSASTTYYWHVRYEDSANPAKWSEYSAEASFTTDRSPNTPVNIAPTNGSMNQNPDLTLTASAFSDPDVGDTQTAAQWQIRSLSDPTYASPVYNSGLTSSNLTSLTVPNGTLAKNTTYFWRVRYRDTLGGQWSQYSDETAFTTGITPITIVSVGATEYSSGEIARLVVQVTDANGTPINTATTTFNLFDPLNVKVASGTLMEHVADSNGLYTYSTTTSENTGVYIYSVSANYNGQTSYASHTFHVSQALNSISNIQTTVGNINTNVNSVNNSISSISSTVGNVSTTLGSVQSSISNVKTNLDILIGAMIVTQSTVSDASPGASSFVTALPNSTNDFYKNAVLTFTGGELNGESRRISSYSGGTKRISLDPALTSAPLNGDAFTVVKQNVYAEEQLQGVSSTLGQVSSTVAGIKSTVDTINANVSTILSTLNTVNSKLDTAQAQVNTIRASQQLGYTVILSHANAVQASSTYKATLTVQDFQSEPVDAGTPTFTIYDSLGGVAEATTSMTRLSTGAYSLSYTVPSNAPSGLWLTMTSLNVGGAAPIVRADHWQVTGAPAQVIITSVGDTTVPTITANTTIQNEGSGAFEYQYEWCVVTSAEAQCDSGTPVYYGSAAKLIQAGESFNTILSANVPNPSYYYFKVLVHFGSQSSGASRSFEATATQVNGGSAVVSVGSAAANPADTSLADIRSTLATQAADLQKAIALMGNLDPNSPGFRTLFAISEENTRDLKDIQNKIAELRAISSVTRQAVEDKSASPIVESFMKFNSVEINFLITNPADTEQTVKFKAFLPTEAKPEYIIQNDGLKVDYDPQAGLYYVSADITLGPKQTATRKVEMKDIWIYSPETIASQKAQAATLIKALTGTQYEAQGALLKGDLDMASDAILTTQAASYSSPQDHIVAFRENAPRADQIKNDLQKLGDLVVAAGAAQGLVGKVGGIQTFATWGITLAIVTGFGLLAAIIFAMWRHQMKLALASMQYDRKILAEIGHEDAKPFVQINESGHRNYHRMPEENHWWRILLSAAIVIFLISLFFGYKYFLNSSTIHINPDSSNLTQ